MNIQQLNNEIGNIDLYLLDQILKGNIKSDDTILDAGCGEGRNLTYFLNNGYSVSGIDANPDAIAMLRFVLGSKYPKYDKNGFIEGLIENMPYQDHAFNYVICNACLHFADNSTHFQQMFAELIRVLAPKGTLFIRTASDIGLKGHTSIGQGVYSLPDGSVRFLLNEKMIKSLLKEYTLALVEPLKTVAVHDHRCMTTLVLKKNQS